MNFDDFYLLIDKRKSPMVLSTLGDYGSRNPGMPRDLYFFPFSPLSFMPFHPFVLVCGLLF